MSRPKVIYFGIAEVTVILNKEGPKNTTNRKRRYEDKVLI